MMYVLTSLFVIKLSLQATYSQVADCSLSVFSDSSRNDTYLLLKSYLLQSTTFVLPWTGIASGLPTDLRRTLHIALVQVATAMDVVGGEDAVEQDTSKYLCPCLNNIIVVLETTSSKFVCMKIII